MKNYHNEQISFSIGQKVTHVTDEGKTATGTVTSIKGDLLHIEFEDGEEGWERAETCF